MVRANHIIHQIHGSQGVSVPKNMKNVRLRVNREL